MPCKCNRGELGCTHWARNVQSYCGPCSTIKRAAGQVVHNHLSPQDASKSVAIKKHKSERSEFEQELVNRYDI